jgi:ketosteroid isomerase-like protein
MKISVRFIEGCNERDVDKIVDCLEDDGHFFCPGLETGQGLREHCAAVFQIFPEVQFSLDWVVSDGDREVCQWTARATRFRDIESGSEVERPFVNTGITVFAGVRAGKATSIRDFWDMHDVLEQMEGSVAGRAVLRPLPGSQDG